MSAAAGWVLIGAGAGIGAICVIMFALGRAAAAGDRQQAHLDEASDFLDNMLATEGVTRDGNPVHAVADEAMVGDDFELWRLECGWS